jgi:tRNA(fMet)-specific endonuclease VapC
VADYLLDTNIISIWYDANRPEHAKVVGRVNTARQPDPETGYVSRFFISVVTLGEIEYGHRVADQPDPLKQAAYAKFVSQQCPDALEMTRKVVEHYGEMRAWLFKNCSPAHKKSKAKRAEQLVYPSTGQELAIDENDIWIAAQAMTYALVLVTHDARGNFGKVLAHFARTLTVEDWAS